MQGKRFSTGSKAALAVFTLILFAASAHAVTEKVLYSFADNGKDGQNPLSSLIFDKASNLYGTTYSGGAYGGGTVFELSPKTGGGWTEKVLHSFGNGTDGIEPSVDLIFDKAGNLYGTTTLGGKFRFGTVFELSPKKGGGWTEKVLHSFNFNGTDAAEPLAGLTLDAAGNLYGTTAYGGINLVGTVFELKAKAGGGWTEKVLLSFGNGMDGVLPSAGLTFDSAGKLYGTTSLGGNGSCSEGCGTVFELMPQKGGGWTEKVLHEFTGNDGELPAGVVFGAAGNLYGTTAFGGSGACSGGCGTVFELMPQKGGSWTEKVLHSFTENGKDGYEPTGSLLLDAKGNIYGTTPFGGSGTCKEENSVGCGTVFELKPIAGGKWTEKLLYAFNNNGKDGVGPSAGLIVDASGNFYGTTYFGGTGTCKATNGVGCGTVFEIKP
jgi:uncharacterized repeat protein (TIGR03803 family)